MVKTKYVNSLFHPVKSFLKNFFQQPPKTIKSSIAKPVITSLGKYEIVGPWTVSNMRDVPSYIPRPPYCESLELPWAPGQPELKSKDQIECMRHSCILAKRVLNHLGLLVKPGVTTDQLDQSAHEMIVNNGAYPSPLNYRGFPKSICTSINNVACHGIPDNRPLLEGDILNIDVTVFLDGYHGDCSAMFKVGKVDEVGEHLISVTETCLMNAIQICRPRENFSSIGNIIQETANKNGFYVIPAFCGHGIGSYFHGPPNILHVANEYGGKMYSGMTFTIEPILSEGGQEFEILEDGWTAVTVDNSRTAQVEHTILITDHGCEILTR